MNKFAGAWPSERAQRRQTKSPAVALLTIHERGQERTEGCCLVAEDLAALS